MKTPTFTQFKEQLSTLGYKDVRTINARAIGIVVPKTQVDAVVPKLTQYYRLLRPVRISDRELKVGEMSLFARNANVQRVAGNFTMGRGNEFNLMQAINEYINDYGKPIDLEFVEMNRVAFKAKDVMKVAHVGAKNVFQRNKADLHLLTSKMAVYPLSIKDITASFWESADKYWGEKAKVFLLWALDHDHTVITHNGDSYSITPNIAVAASSQEIRDVVFGADILGKGAIVVQKFLPQSFLWDFHRDILKITCTKVITNESQVSNRAVYFQIQNDRTRSTEFLQKGMRTKAATFAAVNHPGTKVFESGARTEIGL
jgi:hypothetical protein